MILLETCAVYMFLANGNTIFKVKPTNLLYQSTINFQRMRGTNHTNGFGIQFHNAPMASFSTPIRIHEQKVDKQA